MIESSLQSKGWCYQLAGALEQPSLAQGRIEQARVCVASHPWGLSLSTSHSGEEEPRRSGGRR